MAFVFADFERLRRPVGAAAEIPVDPAHPLAREWGLICLAPGHCLPCRPGPPASGVRAGTGKRDFEVLLSVEPAVVREAAAGDRPARGHALSTNCFADR